MHQRPILRRRVTDDLASAARTHGWPIADVEKMLEHFTVEQVASAIGRMSLDQARAHLTAAKGGPPTLFSDEQDAYIHALKQGRYDLAWLKDARPTWGTRASAGARGLTLMDVNKAYAGTPEEIAPYDTMAPRGAIMDPDSPAIGYSLNKKYEVWAENIAPLYEEAVARQWNATRDIPWGELKPLPDDLERAQCEVCTFLCEVEMIASDFPAKWLWRMNQHYHEVKQFLCTQAMDEARHLDVFRKRALANGGGLLHARAEMEAGLNNILSSPTYVQGSYLMHIVGEGLVLDMFRAGEFLAQNKVEKEIYRLCMQDEARHVAYGTMHLKYYLENHPDRAVALEEVHRVADLGEKSFAAFLVNPYLVEPVAVLAGGGIKHIDRGMDAVKLLWRTVTEEYLKRCDAAGLDRRSRIRVPAEAPY